MADPNNKILTFFNQFPATTYSKNQIVLTAGTQSQFFYFVENGAVKMATTSPTGKNIIFHIFFPGSFFSLLTLATEDNKYDFITLIPTTLRKIPRNELLDLLKSDTDTLWNLQVRLLGGLQGLLNRIALLASTSANSQVASLLLYFAKHFSTSLPKITHQEIADWLGLSRENVSLQMEKLERNKLITTHKGLIKICNYEALQSLAESSL